MNAVNFVEILLVEDNHGDAFLTKKAFQQAKIANNLTHVVNAEKALKVLNKEDEYSNHPSPDLVLLDINMPGKSGMQLLREIREHNALSRIPVVMLTSSEADKDVIDSYDLKANSYIVKPVNLDKFRDVVIAIESFWFGVVKLPPL